MLPRQRQLIAIGLVVLALMLHFLLCSWGISGTMLSIGASQHRIVGWRHIENSFTPTVRYVGLYARPGVDLPSGVALGVALPLALLMLDAWLILSWRHRNLVSQRLCPNCGYDLRAAAGPLAKCPECGEAVTPAA